MTHQRQFSSGRRRGFTLVEVALAVAVGLIIIGGAVMGYGAVKDQASAADGRKRVVTAAAVVNEYAAANFGRYPVSVADDGSGVSTGSFTRMWAKAIPEQYNMSPWGGPAGDEDGVTELAPFANGEIEASAAPDVTNTLTQNGARAGNMIYASITGNRHVGIRQGYNPGVTVAKGYVISIYDRTGSPWFHMSGSRL